MRFLETPTEKQLRVANDWTNLTKAKGMTALQFEAEWEQIHADLDEVGLSKTPLEKFLGYIVKVGPPVNETIRMDRRPRKDGAGGFTTRLPTSWEECHEVLCEIEGVKAGSKAFLAARSAGQTGGFLGAQGGHDSQTYQQGGFGDGNGKGKGKGKGKDGGKGKGKYGGKYGGNGGGYGGGGYGGGGYGGKPSTVGKGFGEMMEKEVIRGLEHAPQILETGLKVEQVLYVVAYVVNFFAKNIANCLA
jgi:hypothetical protein